MSPKIAKLTFFLNYSDLTSIHAFLTDDDDLKNEEVTENVPKDSLSFGQHFGLHLSNLADRIAHGDCMSFPLLVKL